MKKEELLEECDKMIHYLVWGVVCARLQSEEVTVHVPLECFTSAGKCSCRGHEGDPL